MYLLLASAKQKQRLKALEEGVVTMKKRPWVMAAWSTLSGRAAVASDVSVAVIPVSGISPWLQCCCGSWQRQNEPRAKDYSDAFLIFWLPSHGRGNNFGGPVLQC